MKNEPALFIVGVCIGFIAALIICSKPAEIKPPEYIEGTPDTIFVRGKTDTVFVEKKVYQKEILIADSTKEFSVFEKTIDINKTDNEDAHANIDLKITTYPGIDSLALEWFGVIEARSFHRVDTLKIFQVDTLKTYVPQPKAFYDNFETGFGVAAIIILIITYFIK